MSSGRDVFGRTMPWKRFGAPQHDRLDVAEEELRLDVVRPDGDDLLAEVEGVERLDQDLAALLAL